MKLKENRTDFCELSLREGIKGANLQSELGKAKIAFAVHAPISYIIRVTLEIVLVLAIAGTALLLFITEWVRMEVVALLVLGTLAVTGLLTPPEALAGFSNPAVVTIWALFILSGALGKAGVAKMIGGQILRYSGRGEARLMLGIMLGAALLSAFMSNLAVAALLLPVVMDIARQERVPASRLLIPLAFGSILGSMTTLIGRPANLLASEMLRQAGESTFSLFDFAPIGVAAVLVGVLYMVKVGRPWLPKRDTTTDLARLEKLDLRQYYSLQERSFLMRVPNDCLLVGKTLAETRIRSVLGLEVVAILRRGQTMLAPPPDTTLRTGDKLLMQGKVDKLESVRGWGHLALVKESFSADRILSSGHSIAEVRLSARSSHAGMSLAEIGFRKRYHLHVLAVRYDGNVQRTELQDVVLKPGMFLLVEGTKQRMAALKEEGDFETLRLVSEEDLFQKYKLQESIFHLRIPKDSSLVDQTLGDSRLGDALGCTVLNIIRHDKTIPMPDAEEKLLAGDKLVVEGRSEYVELARGYQQLELETEAETLPDALDTDTIGLTEAVLAPRSRLMGRSLRQIRFRDRYGLVVLAVWRGGRAYRSNLRDIVLQFGDALLLYGPREKMMQLGMEPDFLVLTQAAQEPVQAEKAPVALTIMGTVLLPAIFGLVPIYISVIIGAALVVLTGCLKMDDAYRVIEWRAVFVIAGMLPLGMALEKTGAAQLVADGLVAVAGPLGVWGVLVGLYLFTSIATLAIHPAALVVLMAPVALNAASAMGISPHAIMMATAFAAGSTFMSPVAHPVNLLVMGPGGYRFGDYVKVGAPLTLLVFAVVLLVLPYVFPLTP